jgi:hypothetical protein
MRVGEHGFHQGTWRYAAKGQEKKQFFFEKKNQKTFVTMAFALAQRISSRIKVFASFFKKKRFLGSHVLIS